MSIVLVMIPPLVVGTLEEDPPGQLAVTTTRPQEETPALMLSGCCSVMLMVTLLFDPSHSTQTALRGLPLPLTSLQLLCPPDPSEGPEEWAQRALPWVAQYLKLSEYLA